MSDFKCIFDTVILKKKKRVLGLSYILVAHQKFGHRYIFINVVVFVKFAALIFFVCIGIISKEVTVDNYTEKDIEEAFKADLDLLGNYFITNEILFYLVLEMGGKNEKGFTLDECFTAYQVLRKKLKDKKTKAVWKAAMEGQN